MKREEQIALIETVEDRLNKLADRVMSEPVIRESITRRADEQHAQQRYEVTTMRVKYG